MEPNMGAIVVVALRDKTLRASLVSILKEAGCKVSDTGTSAQALQLVSKTFAGVLVCEDILPGMSGEQLAQLVRRLHPHVKIVCVAAGAKTPNVLFDAQILLSDADVGVPRLFRQWNLTKAPSPTAAAKPPPIPAASAPPAAKTNADPSLFEDLVGLLPDADQMVGVEGMDPVIIGGSKG